MWKKMTGCFVLFMGWCVFQSFNASAEELSYTQAPYNQDLSDEIEGPYSPIPMVIRGQVKFERRYTRVLQEFCDDLRCPQSEVYWTIVIHSGKSRYLLNQKFYKGELKSPESIEFFGILLRPGTIIQLDGDIIKTSPGFFTIQRVNEMNVLMD